MLNSFDSCIKTASSGVFEGITVNLGLWDTAGTELILLVCATDGHDDVKPFAKCLSEIKRTICYAPELWLSSARANPGRPVRHGALHQFTQQNLPACKPVLTPAAVISTFLLMGLIFIPVGIVTLRASYSVVEIVDRYDNDCVPEEYRGNKVAYVKDNSIPKNCSRFLKINSSSSMLSFKGSPHW
ncbi:unnamed protein product [Vicia faba]|uniref:Uncharacterized protein n=1 Tax=Vicia faba TaxID=3906 RepID=A0AAV0ZD02_VICFA|nr:unnamed protein product [Vicia faba]